MRLRAVWVTHAALGCAVPGRGGPVRGQIDRSLAQDLSDRGRGDLHPESEQFATGNLMLVFADDDGVRVARPDPPVETRMRGLSASPR
jgi:hypothetical protein